MAEAERRIEKQEVVKVVETPNGVVLTLDEAEAQALLAIVGQFAFAVNETYTVYNVLAEAMGGSNHSFFSVGTEKGVIKEALYLYDSRGRRKDAPMRDEDF